MASLKDRLRGLSAAQRGSGNHEVRFKLWSSLHGVHWCWLLQKYKMTLLFACTAVVFMAIAAVLVHQIIGRLAQDNLARIAERQASRNALHLESMINGPYSVFAPSHWGTTNYTGIKTPEPVPLTLEFLSSPEGLEEVLPVLIHGAAVSRVSLYDLNGAVVWSSSHGPQHEDTHDNPLIREAIYTGVISTFKTDQKIIDHNGNPLRSNVVESYLPLRRLPSGHIIGILEVQHQLDPNVLAQVDQARSTALWTTVSVMGVLFLLLIGFVAVADVSLHRSKQREIEVIEESNERLERSNRELQDFASIAAHDLQEPLRKVEAFGDRLLIKCGDTLSEQGRDYLDRMLNAAGRMRSLIDDLLAFSRVNSRGEPFTKVNLDKIAQDVLSDLEVAIERADGEVKIDHLATIEADPTQMRQLFQNLIGNALKFRHPGRRPSISISGRLMETSYQHKNRHQSLGSDYQIIIKDNGIGFDEKYLDRMFSLFQRLHGRGEYEGNGVGLAVCHKIAERHGGCITAKSTEGEGATFMITLPVTNTREVAEE